MNLHRFNRFVVASLRSLFAVCFAVLILFSPTLPAFAIGGGIGGGQPGGSPSSPTKGEEVLDETYDQSKAALRREPRSRQELEGTAEGGAINEVQGAADRDKFYSPENSPESSSIEEMVKEGLEKITGQ